MYEYVCVIVIEQSERPSNIYPGRLPLPPPKSTLDARGAGFGARRDGLSSGFPCEEAAEAGSSRQEIRLSTPQPASITSQRPPVFRLGSRRQQQASRSPPQRPSPSARRKHTRKRDRERRDGTRQGDRRREEEESRGGPSQYFQVNTHSQNLAHRGQSSCCELRSSSSLSGDTCRPFRATDGGQPEVGRSLRKDEQEEVAHHLRQGGQQVIFAHDVAVPCDSGRLSPLPRGCVATIKTVVCDRIESVLRQEPRDRP